MMNVMHTAIGAALALLLALAPGASTRAAQAHPATAAAATAADQAFTRLADGYFDSYYRPANPSTVTADGCKQRVTAP